MKTNGLFGSRLLAEKAYSILQVNLRRHFGHAKELLPALNRYQKILRTIEERYEIAVLNLTDDLREAWETSNSRIRPWLTALLWTLGLVPESSAIHKSNSLPSRRLLKQVINRSIECIPDDPLIQYIWLELKNDTSIDLRAHQALFSIINHYWDQWLIDKRHQAFGFNVEPSRIYSQTLIKLFANGLSEAMSTEYMITYKHILDTKAELPYRCEIIHRLHMLCHLIAKRFHYYGTDLATASSNSLSFLKGLTESECDSQIIYFRYPENPACQFRTSHSSFDFIEFFFKADRELNRTSNGHYNIMVNTMERFRMGAILYWLQVNPPLIICATAPEDVMLFQEEQKLLQDLRGAYFLVLGTILPQQFNWNDIDWDDLVKIQEPAKRKWFYSPDVARKEMIAIEESLIKLADRFSVNFAKYATQRRAPNATIEQLISILNFHVHKISLKDS